MPAADRMRAMRERRRIRGMREVRLNLLDARLEAVRRRVAGEVAALNPGTESEVNPGTESEALDWIEAVSEFDDGDEAR
jgi:hypothetical protein